MIACPELMKLRGFLEGRLSEAENQLVHDHAAVCGDCDRKLEELAQAAQELLPSLPAQDRMAKASGPPDIPGYRILEELGRGGMGVVYKAAHPTLPKVVALKVILSGAHAGPEALARFRTEAEAAARLQHPNIVQVLDFGEHEGRPYFTMEYVQGGNLGKQTQGQPQPERKAAERVLTLARAVHAAHQIGVIHRDLKPANVLVTEQGLLKITDFGLAKRMPSPTDTPLPGATPDVKTPSGAIVGTPSYMAPEQARPGSKSIGPTTDVYALGSNPVRAADGQTAVPGAGRGGCAAAGGGG